MVRVWVDVSCGLSPKESSNRIPLVTASYVFLLGVFKTSLPLWLDSNYPPIDLRTQSFLF